MRSAFLIRIHLRESKGSKAWVASYSQIPLVYVILSALAASPVSGCSRLKASPRWDYLVRIISCSESYAICHSVSFVWASCISGQVMFQYGVRWEFLSHLHFFKWKRSRRPLAFSSEWFFSLLIERVVSTSHWGFQISQRVQICQSYSELTLAQYPWSHLTPFRRIVYTNPRSCQDVD